MRIIIRGTPTAKQSFRRFKNKNTGEFQNHRDPKVEDFNNSVISQITNQLPPDYIPISRAIRINYLEFRFKYVKNWNRQLMSIVSDPSSIWQIGKDNQKDCDNLLKAIGDAFNSIVWRDDKLIVEICNIRKIYSLTPGITIDFEEITDYCGKLPLLRKCNPGEDEVQIPVSWEAKND